MKMSLEVSVDGQNGVLWIGEVRYAVNNQKEVLEIIRKLELGDVGESRKVSEDEYTRFVSKELFVTKLKLE